MYADPVRPVNVARFTFLSPRSREFFRDWDQAATDIVASLRTEAGRNPYDKGLSDLIGELSTRSEEFRIRWAAHNVRQHTSGTKRLHHPIAGDLDLGFEAMQLPGDAGLTVVIYPPSPARPPPWPCSSWPAGLIHSTPRRLKGLLLPGRQTAADQAA